MSPLSATRSSHPGPARIPVPWRRIAILIGILAAAWALAGPFEASEAGLSAWGHPLPETCPAAAVGSACPGCGMTRAGVSLLQGNPVSAWNYHPGIYLLLLLPALFLLEPWLGRTWCGRLRVGLAVALLGVSLAQFWELI